MNRRCVLAALGAGSLGFAGCLGVLDDSTPCEPAEDETALENGIILINEPGVRAPRISVRGTIVAFPDRGLLLSDGTGVARISTGLGYDFEMDELSRGDCVRSAVTLDKRATWDNKMPILSVRGEEFEKVGASEDDLTSRFDEASPPAAVFDTDFDSEVGSATTAVTLTHRGGSLLSPSDLYVCYGPERDGVRRPTLAQTTVETWAALSGSTAEVTAGDAVTVDLTARTQGTLLWQSDTGWGKQLTGFAVG